MDEIVLRQFFDQFCKRYPIPLTDVDYAWGQFLKCKIILENHCSDIYDEAFNKGYEQKEIELKLEDNDAYGPNYYS
jgi:hypothetical protein